MGLFEKFKTAKTTISGRGSSSNHVIAKETSISADRIRRAQKKDVKNEDIGLTVLVEPKCDKTSMIDIVAVHGIGANPTTTWVWEKDGKEDVNWLDHHDMLPKQVSNARIMRFGYNSKWFGSSDEDHTTTTVHDVSKALITHLDRLRKEYPTRPLIFIAHSFGGLPVMHALRSSHDNPREWGNSFQSTVGLVFLGVPIRGRQGPPIEEWTRKILTENPTFQIWPQTMSASIPESQYLQGLVDRYLETRNCDHPLPVSCFYETKPSPVGKLWDPKNPNPEKWYLVSKGSACLDPSKGITCDPLVRHHYNLQKFEGPEDGQWKVIVPRITKLAEDATQFLEKRARGANFDFLVTFRLYHLKETARFVARGRELKEIEERLQTEPGRQYAVLLGAGGIGKTQLAISYAKIHKNRYSAVFFLNIRSKESIHRSYDIIGARIATEHPTATRLRALFESTKERSPKAVVSAVNQWLEIPNNSGWLMVFDNYDNPAIPGYSDPENVNIENYCPDVDHGSIIVTTRVERVQLGPLSPIRVRPLSDSDGLKILENRSERGELSGNKHAKKLTKRLGGHPLSLAIAGSYLKVSFMSFEDYLALYTTQWSQLQRSSLLLNDYDHNLLTAWKITSEKLKKDHPDSVDMLKIFGYTYDGFLQHEWLVLGGMAMAQRVQRLISRKLTFSNTMIPLINYCLVELDQSDVEPNQDPTLAYTMHPVIHAWCKNDLNKDLDVELAWSIYACASCVTIHRSKRYPKRPPRLRVHEFRTWIAKNESAQNDLRTVWQTNSNIMKLLRSRRGFEMPSDWEALDFLLGHIGDMGFTRDLHNPIDTFEEIFTIEFETHVCEVERSSFITEELEDIIAKGGVIAGRKSWRLVSSNMGRNRQRRKNGMSIQEMQTLGRYMLGDAVNRTRHRYIAEGKVVSREQWYIFSGMPGWTTLAEKIEQEKAIMKRLHDQD